jgi:protein-tyrosine phosphatase
MQSKQQIVVAVIQALDDNEVQWVIDRLRARQRVLVHCSAGFNRSVTVCCAALILLEGISAENALERVREHHPWAYPDAHHWLVLRWLAQRFAGGC